MYIGAAYYPELWPDNEIQKDIAHMKEAGIRCVRMGEFAWSKMEPEIGTIHLDFFAGAISQLHSHGIDTIFCTPTPTPPIWMSDGHPERMHVNEKGERMSHGARQHCCINHPFFRKRARIIAEAIARQIGPLPGLIGWQIDNELKSSLSECMCATCKSLWTQWLQARYLHIDALNEAWGTEIWSQKYQNFQQVPQPVQTTLPHNASLSTAYRQFNREQVAAFIREQAEILRRHSTLPITHNTNRIFHVDNEQNFQSLDFASFDAYPESEHFRQMMLDYDLWRNAIPRRPFWVMETSPYSAGNLRAHTKTHPSGYLCAEAVAAYASGAEGFSFWLWRQQRTGFEIAHGAVLSSWGEPTVGYREIQRIKEAAEELEPLLIDSEPAQAEAAITYSDRARAFFMTESMEQLDYLALMSHWYNIVLDSGIHRDLLFENADLTGYRLLLSPFLPYLSPAYMEKAKDFVRSGGIWLAGPLTGWRTKEHTAHTDAFLGDLESFAGVKTLFAYPMSRADIRGEAFQIQATLGLTGCEWIPSHPETVVQGRYSHASGHAFLTEKPEGKGRIVLLGHMPQGAEGDRMLGSILRYYAAEAGIRMRWDVSAGTIVAPRHSKGKRIWIIVNMDGKGGTVTLPKAGTDLLCQEPVPQGPLKIDRYGYKAIGWESPPLRNPSAGKPSAGWMNGV
ncbi:MAG TPA: beta-galactosidase [Clostridiales bacterium]|nr:beta-galactosidase [Clostridiales bacterium]